MFFYVSVLKVISSKRRTSVFRCHESRRSFYFVDNFVLRFAVPLCFGTAVFLHLQTSFKSTASWSPTAFLTELVNEPQVMVKISTKTRTSGGCLEVYWFKSTCNGVSIITQETNVLNDLH